MKLKKMTDAEIEAEQNEFRSFDSQIQPVATPSLDDDLCAYKESLPKVESDQIATHSTQDDEHHVQASEDEPNASEKEVDDSSIEVETEESPPTAINNKETQVKAIGDFSFEDLSADHEAHAEVNDSRLKNWSIDDTHGSLILDAKTDQQAMPPQANITNSAIAPQPGNAPASNAGNMANALADIISVPFLLPGAIYNKLKSSRQQLKDGPQPIPAPDVNLDQWREYRAGTAPATFARAEQYLAEILKQHDDDPIFQKLEEQIKALPEGERHAVIANFNNNKLIDVDQTQKNLSIAINAYTEEVKSAIEKLTLAGRVDEAQALTEKAQTTLKSASSDRSWLQEMGADKINESLEEISKKFKEAFDFLMEKVFGKQNSPSPNHIAY